MYVHLTILSNNDITLLRNGYNSVTGFFIFIILITIAYLLKKQNDERIKQVDIKTKEPSAVKVWIQLNKHRTHDDYDKWYEKREKKLQTNDSINVIVPAHYTLSRIFIAPYGETPFFNDEL